MVRTRTDRARREDRVESYLALRETQRRINSQLIKRLDKAMVEGVARRLGLWHRGRVVAESEADFDVLCDFCIYDCFTEGKNVVARYRAEGPVSAGAETVAVLEAMGGGNPFSLFRIDAVRPGVGVQLLDLLTNEKVFVFDQGLGTTGRSGICIGGRLLRFHSSDICMTTGAAVEAEGDLAGDLVDDIHAEIDADRRTAQDAISRAAPVERSRIAVRILRMVLAGRPGDSDVA